MSCRHSTFSVRTSSQQQVLDVTERVRGFVESCGIGDGLCTVFAPHATAAITVNENDDPNIGVDLIRALQGMVPEHPGWLHDQIDDNAAAHIKAAIIGPSASIPIVSGQLALGRWQNIFLCEFDGPRSDRRIIVSVVD